MSSLPLFDGSYRSKRVVSLRGDSKQNEPSLSLLNKAHLKREERELIRKRNQAAVTVQSFIRGALIRKRVNRQLRSLFDQSISNCADHTHLIGLTSSKFLVFYNAKKDHDRLVIICQKWIQFKVPILAELSSLKSPAHYILFRVLVLCLESLFGDPNQPLAPPLRLLEVFTFNVQHSVTLLQKLLHNNYFRTFRHLLETRVPPPDGDGCGLVPLSSELVKFIENGLEINSLFFIIQELLAPPLSPHLSYIILPLLSKPRLSLPSLVATARHEAVAKRLLVTPTLCYCFMELYKSEVHIHSEPVLTDILTLLSLMFELHQVNDTHHMREEDDEIEEEGEDMDVDPVGGDDRSIINYLLTEINNGSLINRLPIKRKISSEVLSSLCSICYHVIMNTAASVRYRSSLLSSLSFSSPLIRQVWLHVTSLTLERSFGPPIKCLDYLAKGMSLPPAVGVVILECMTVFSCLLSISFSSLHDTEVTSLGPFTLKELGGVSLILRDLFVVLHLETHLKGGAVLDSRPHPFEWTALADLLCSLLKELHSRNVRLGFIPPERWSSLSLSKVPPELFLEEEEEESPMKLGLSVSTIKHTELLKRAPFVFPFIERVIFLHKLIRHSRSTAQGQYQDFLIGPSLSVTARRTHLYEDAFNELSAADLRKRLRVTLINAQGLDEPGIDGGGLFREFLSETIKTGYNPNRGYFMSSDEGTLYPNTLSYLFSEDYKVHYEFLGSLLGKALYENMLVELPFASFFLRKLTTPGRGWVGPHYLSSLDSEYYRQVLSLKNYDGDFDELDIYFTTLSNEYGQIKLVELKPGGKDIKVTSNNKIEFIHLLCHYHLNLQMERQFQSFRKGVNSVIPLLWLTLFNEQELQTLISGTQSSIDLDDLYKHTHYSGAYSSDHETIKLFWEVLRDFNEKQKQDLLKFVTSCSHAPLLGFSELHPPFSILSARESDHLPSASTCMHLLKLPMFNNKEILREKLLYAISSGAGFELS